MTIEIGSIVRPTIGPHQSEAHEVVHMFSDGHANIRLIEGRSAYKNGHITADPKYLVEEVILEEYQEPHGTWWNGMSKSHKESYRRNHPDAQGTFGHEPGSYEFHKAKAKAHQKYADWHDERMNHHHDQVSDHIQNNSGHDKISHHAYQKKEHSEHFYMHSMKAAHHSAIRSGGTPSLVGPGQSEKVAGY